MKAIQSQFLDLLGANLIQFIIPVYQRIYSWDSKQCKDLWEDTMRAGRKNELHFIGSFLYTPESASTTTSLKRNPAKDMFAGSIPFRWTSRWSRKSPKSALTSATARLWEKSTTSVASATSTFRCQTRRLQTGSGLSASWYPRNNRAPQRRNDLRYGSDAVLEREAGDVACRL